MGSAATQLHELTPRNALAHHDHSPSEPASLEAATPRHLTSIRPHPAAQALCNHPIWDEPGGLTCIRDAGHSPGHVYRDTTGSAVDDRHADGGHG